MGDHRPLCPLACAGTWDAEGVVRALKRWTDEVGRAPRSFERAPTTGRAMGMLGPEPCRWEIEWPAWPSTATVASYFGSWCKALRAAGLPARIPERDLPLRERVEVARRLRAQGLTQAVIADALQVSRLTVRCYLAAEPCPNCGRPITTVLLGRKPESCQRCAARENKAPEFTADQVLEALRRWAAETGSAPRRDDWELRPRRGQQPNAKWMAERGRWPSAAQVATHFGTFERGVRRAGVPRFSERRRCRDD